MGSPKIKRALLNDALRFQRGGASTHEQRSAIQDNSRKGRGFVSSPLRCEGSTTGGDPSLEAIDCADAVGIEHIVQGDYPFELVDVGAVYNGQKIEMMLPHALKRDIHPLIGMNVRES